MTEQQILEKIGVDNTVIFKSSNGGWYWVACRREHDGQWYSHSAKVPLEPTDQDLNLVKAQFTNWWGTVALNHLEKINVARETNDPNI